MARSLSHSGAHHYDGDAAGASSSRHRSDADATTAGGDKLLALNGESADIDVYGNGSGGGNGNASTAASAAAADHHRLLSMRYDFENAKKPKGRTNKIAISDLQRIFFYSMKVTSTVVCKPVVKLSLRD